jgi:hypothetical protein
VPGRIGEVTEGGSQQTFKADRQEDMKAGPEVFLEHERLDVYRAALAFDALASKSVPRRGHGVLRDQLDRASIKCSRE